MDSAAWVIASFTCVLSFFTALLWWTTSKYTKITRKLLEQSEMASKQSRIAFLADMIQRTLDLERELVDPKMTFYGQYWDKPGKLHKDLGEVFGDIDENFGKDFIRVMDRFQKLRREEKELNNG